MEAHGLTRQEATAKVSERPWAINAAEQDVAVKRGTVSLLFCDAVRALIHLNALACRDSESTLRC